MYHCSPFSHLYHLVHSIILTVQSVSTLLPDHKAFTLSDLQPQLSYRHHRFGRYGRSTRKWLVATFKPHTRPAAFYILGTKKQRLQRSCKPPKATQKGRNHCSTKGACGEIWWYGFGRIEDRCEKRPKTKFSRGSGQVDTYPAIRGDCSRGKSSVGLCGQIRLEM